MGKLASYWYLIAWKKYLSIIKGFLEVRREFLKGVDRFRLKAVTGLCKVNIWPEQDYTNSKTLVHSLLYRLRKLLGINDSQSNHCLTIDYSQGGYCLYLHYDCRLDVDEDVDEFVEMSNEASKLVETDPSRAIEHYKRAFSLYQGLFKRVLS